MNKYALVLSMILMPTGVFAFTAAPTIPASIPSISVPSSFQTSGKTSVVQWGCPVLQEVQANTPTEALNLMSQACMAEAKKAVAKKPGVFDVIQVSVVWPDVNVSENKGRYLLRGTFFLETLVLKTVGQ